MPDEECQCETSESIEWVPTIDGGPGPEPDPIPVHGILDVVSDTTGPG